MDDNAGLLDFNMQNLGRNTRLVCSSRLQHTRKRDTADTHPALTQSTHQGKRIVGHRQQKTCTFVFSAFFLQTRSDRRSDVVKVFLPKECANANTQSCGGEFCNSPDNVNDRLSGEPAETRGQRIPPVMRRPIKSFERIKFRLQQFRAAKATGDGAQRYKLSEFPITQARHLITACCFSDSSLVGEKTLNR
ncbi:hypothetical protein HPB51_008812 [Rhipicephalus microplus]|uniref:Uncharacterized protein n=1 Tax=Rhipicephalus microplus TaxID=6941 RepID=A0A9J6ERV1_RHIMP|nr:hypothetical protein HPB51_008812 [Rhipicephalus microplus]